MLVLALVGSLGGPAAMPDTVTRLPGTRLRLGMPEARVIEGTAFAEVKAPEAGISARKGDARFFGVPCQATYLFRNGRLAGARFEVAGVSPHAIDYVEDQLRQAGLRRECARYEPGNHQCDWLGRSIQVHLKIQDNRLESRIDPWPPPVEAVADSLPAGVAVAPDSTGDAAGAADVPLLPETFVISLVSKNSPSDWPRVASSQAMAETARVSGEGVVWVLALVDADGRVRRATVERSVPGLDEAAVSWVTGARFAPCERDGQPCRFQVRIAVRFGPP
jgi:TonB family protein